MGAEVCIHGFCGGGPDFGLYSGARVDSGDKRARYSYSRGRILDSAMQPDHAVGTRAVERSAAEALDVILVVADMECTDRVRITTHSIGGPAIFGAVGMVIGENLPPRLQDRQADLELLIPRLEINCVAPAGLTDNFVLMPFAGQIVYPLMRTLVNASGSIIGECSSSDQLISQLPRALRAANYILGEPLLSIEEGIDSSGPYTMQFAADMARYYPGSVKLYTQDQDELFPSHAILSSLRDPNNHNYDGIVHDMLDPRSLLRYARSKGISGLLPHRLLETVAESVSRSRESGLSDDQVKSLAVLADEAVGIPGNHTAILTSKGAKRIVDASP